MLTLPLVSQTFRKLYGGGSEVGAARMASRLRQVAAAVVETNLSVDGSDEWVLRGTTADGRPWYECDTVSEELRYLYASDSAGGFFLTATAPDVTAIFRQGGEFANETVGEYKGKPLYYRGKRNREAAYASLLATAGLGDATDVVISGCAESCPQVRRCTRDAEITRQAGGTKVTRQAGATKVWRPTGARQEADGMVDKVWCPPPPGVVGRRRASSGRAGSALCWLADRAAASVDSLGGAGRRRRPRRLPVANGPRIGCHILPCECESAETFWGW